MLKDLGWGAAPPDTQMGLVLRRDCSFDEIGEFFLILHCRGVYDIMIRFDDLPATLV